MSRAQGRVLALALLLAFAGCSRNRQGAMAPLEEGATAAVTVHNHNHADVNVYAVPESGLRTRLGTVTAASTATFTLTSAVLRTGQLRLTAVPIGGVGEAASGPLLVGPGQEVVFRVEADLRLSTASVQ